MQKNSTSFSQDITVYSYVQVAVAANVTQMPTQRKDRKYAFSI